MYLVDTNVISAAAPTKALPDRALLDWMDAHSDRLFLSVVTIAEIEDGICKASREGARRKAARIAEWLAALLHLYSARVLPFDLRAARLAGCLSDRARDRGQAPGFADLTIAAIAESHGYIVLTRNLRHFRTIGVPAHDPFAGLP